MNPTRAVLRLVVRSSLLAAIVAVPTSLLALDGAVGPNGIDALGLQQSPTSLTGTGVSVGLLGDQIDDSHPNLNVVGNGGVGVPTGLFTQLAGSINSDDSVYTGVAPGADLYGYTVNEWTDLFESANWLVRQGATIVVYPYGTQLGGDLPDGDSWQTRHVDFLASDSDVLFSIAGNIITSGGNTFPLPRDSYNGLVVNATAMTNTGRYDQVAAWNDFDTVPSDGRLKPDLLAPGGYNGVPDQEPESIHTTALGGGFVEDSGTVYSAGFVAGAAALLTQYGGQSGQSTNHNVLRSVLLNSADKSVLDFSGEDWLLSEAYADMAVPLDDQLGAGQLDAAAAFEQYRAGEHDAGSVPLTGWDVGAITGESSEHLYQFEAELTAGSYVTVTAAWDRRIILEDDEDGDGEFDISSPLDWLVPFDLNNLDLRLYDDTGALVAGSLSAVDNIEHLHWLVPSDGMYSLGVMFQQQFDQETVPYAVAWNVSAGPRPFPLGSVATGNWNAMTTWDDGTTAPTGDHAVAVGDHIVTVAADGNAASLVIGHDDGQILVAGGQTLAVVGQVDVDAGSLRVEGAITAAAARVGDARLSLGPVGMLEVDGLIAMDAGSRFEVELAGASSGMATAAGGVTLDPDTRLELVASGGLDAVGDASMTILAAIDGGQLSGTFGEHPSAGDHLGYGVFHEGLFYEDQSVRVDLLQAAAGDADGNRDVNGFDIQAILSANRFGKPLSADWTEGDFTGDGFVNGFDIQAILSANLFGRGPYASTGPGIHRAMAVPEPSTLALAAAGLLGALCWRRRKR